MIKHLINVVVIAIGMISQSASANSQDNQLLFAQMTELDNILFEESFNQCNNDKLPSIISVDFEFYHDVAGVQNKAEFLKAVEKNICSNPAQKPIRKLVAGSMELFPMKYNGVLYGVIQRGVHEFYIKEPNKELYKTGIAKFTHLWLLNNHQWQLKRVLSFDHQAASD